MGEFVLEPRQFEEASRRGEEERAKSPIPAAVRYDRESGRIVVDFTNGASFMVPARSLQDLADANDDEIAEVELAGETALHWERLDVDFSIAGLMNGIFGTARFMEAQRRGGQSKSPAKIAAARSNGAKGGRPRKAQ